MVFDSLNWLSFKIIQKYIKISVNAACKDKEMRVVELNWLQRRQSLLILCEFISKFFLLIYNLIICRRIIDIPA